MHARIIITAIAETETKFMHEAKWVLLLREGSLHSFCL